MNLKQVPENTNISKRKPTCDSASLCARGSTNARLLGDELMCICMWVFGFHLRLDHKVDMECKN